MDGSSGRHVDINGVYFAREQPDYVVFCFVDFFEILRGIGQEEKLSS